MAERKENVKVEGREKGKTRSGKFWNIENNRKGHVERHRLRKKKKK